MTSPVTRLGRLLIPVLLWASGTAALGDPLRLPRLDHMGPEEGLAHSTVTAVHQDRRGFIWLATESYLQRFDGIELTAFRHDPEDPHSLSESQVTTLFEDSAGRLWLGTRSRGVNLWQQDVERFVSFLPGDDPETLTPGTVSSLAEGADGALWVGTRNGLNRLDPTTGKVRRFVHDPERPGSLRSDGIVRVLVDRRGDLWVSHFAGLDRLDPSSEEPRFIAYGRDPEDPRSLAGDFFSSLFEDSRGVLWIGDWEGVLYRYHPETDDFTRFVPGDDGQPGVPAVRTMEEGPDGRLWLGTQGKGLALFDPASGRFSRAPMEAGNPFALSFSKVFDLEQDRGGVLWIAGDNGLDRLIHRRLQFDVRRQGGNDPVALPDANVSALLEDDRERLWVGTQGGHVAVYGKRDGEERRIAHWSPEGSGHPTGMVRALVQDAAGKVWVGSRDGVWSLKAAGPGAAGLEDDVQGARFEELPGEAPAVESGLYHRGNLWLGTDSGLLQVRLEDLSRQTAMPVESGPRSATAGRIYALLAGGPETGRGDGVYLATEGGFFHFDAQTRRFEELGGAQKLASLNLVALHRDRHGVFWLGSYGGGLTAWRPGDDTWTHYHEGSGLPSDKVVGILEAAAGELWLATNDGLSRLTPSTGSFRNYDAGDGLHGKVAFIGAVVRRKSGALALGGPGGMTLFDPADLRDDPVGPTVALTGLTVGDEPVHPEPGGILERSIQVTDELELGHRDRTFAVELAALAFGDPRENRYAYRLEGYDRETAVVDALHRRARYTNLDPGTYVFRARASNPDGVWGEDRTLTVRILPAPWETWWAYAGYFLALASGALLFVHRQRVKLLREREIADRLREADRLKDQLLSNTSHELRTPLQGITGLAESLLDGGCGELPEEARGDLSLLLASGRRLSLLVDDLLDFSRLEHHEIRLALRPVDLHTLAEVVLTLSRLLPDGAELELRNEVPEDLPAVEADEHRLAQVLHNLVGNAVKFTASGSVAVRARVEGGKIRVEVADTGIGISEELHESIFEPFRQVEGAVDRGYGGTGLGLAVTRRLVELHGGEIGLSSTPGEGSTFFLTLDRAAGAPSDAPARSRLLSDPESLGVPRPRPASEMTEERGQEQEGAGEGRILVVDDEAVNRRVLERFLTAEGYGAVTARDGETALDLLAEQSFDLVLLDVMMPRLSGYDVCREIRSHRAVEDLPIIFLSAKIQPADVVTGMALGANDFLRKPISKVELLARIRPHLALLAVYRRLAGLVEEKISEIKVLGGLLPICADCKRIRDDEGRWAELETFIASRSEARFTHGICPTCAGRQYSEIDKAGI